jgi:DNA primase
MALITRSTLDEIKERLPISALVGRQVQLKRCGHEWRGLSPRTRERTASLYVNDAKGLAFDFSAGVTSNHFDWVMEFDVLSFPEAVEKLAAQAGIPVTRDAITRETAALNEARDQAFAAMQAAQDHFRACLFRNKAAQDYLNERGIRRQTAALLGIGWAPPPGKELLEHLADEGFSMDTLRVAGLVSESSSAKLQSFFRGRITFPIRNRQGKVLSFGARGIAGELPKYINGADSPLFSKGSAIFALDRTRKAIAQSGQAILLEGYFDVAVCSQAGVENVCATLGTAVSVAQLHQLWRIAPSIVVCLDGDEAGGRAANRTLETALPWLAGDRRISFARLPAGFDPDDLVRRSGRDAFEAVIRSAEHPTDSLWRVLRAEHPGSEAADLAALETRAKAHLSVVADESMRRAMLDGLKDRIRTARTGKQRSAGITLAKRVAAAIPAREAALMIAAVLHPEYVHADFEALAMLDVRTPVCAQIRDKVVSTMGDGRAVDVDALSRDLAVLRTALPSPAPSFVTGYDLAGFRAALDMQQQEAARMRVRAAYQPAA